MRGDPDETTTAAPAPPPVPPDGNGAKALGPFVTRIVALAITLVWVASFVADVLSDEYAPSPLIHAAMIGLGAAVFGTGFVRGLR